MQTTKLISSISYNSETFLVGKLHTLVRSGILEYAHWVKHFPEDDETKEHIHIVVKPNKRLDTSALRNEFLEVLPNEDKPRCLLPFRTTSRMSDWMLYSAHDVLYLLKKDETRKYQYEKADFRSTDSDLLDEDWRDCHRTSDSHIPTLKRMASEGFTWEKVVSMGFLPINQYFAYRDMYFQFFQSNTSRGGRDGHEEI